MTTLDSGQIVAELNTVYSEIESALRAGDLATVERYMSPVFDGATLDGTQVSRDDVMDNLRALLRDSEVVSWPRKVTYFETNGQLIEATSEGAFTTRDGAGRLKTVDLKNVDVWLHSGGGWVMIASRAA